MDGLKEKRAAGSWIILAVLGLVSFGAADDGGIIQDGLQIRMVPLQQNFIVGRPMKVRVDIINRNTFAVKVKYTADDIQGDDFMVTGPEDIQVTYIDSGEYPERELSM